MYLTWRAAAVTLESLAAITAALNSLYFLTRCLDADERTGRRVAAFVLALVSAGILLESAVLAAVSAGGETSIPLVPLAWTRWVLIAGTLGMCLLVVRRLSGR